MSDTFKSAEWQAYMQAELAWSRRPCAETAAKVIETSDAWALAYLTPPQRKALAAKVLYKMKNHQGDPMQGHAA